MKVQQSYFMNFDEQQSYESWFSSKSLKAKHHDFWVLFFSGKRMDITTDKNITGKTIQQENPIDPCISPEEVNKNDLIFRK